MPPLGSVAGVKARLAAAGLRPRHRLGQNFLCHPGILEAVVAAAELGSGDSVLEVGAGLGVLTAELTARAGRVVALEIDRDLCRVLSEHFGTVANLKLVCADVLEASDGELELPAAGRPFKVVANIPYYLTSPLLERIVDRWRGCTLAVLMVQEEVARRLVAPPGGGDYGSLTVFVGYHAQVELFRQVPASAFWPQPKVGSAIIRLRRHSAPPVEAAEEVLFGVVRAAFGQRRKQLRNSLGGPPLGLERAEAGEVLAITGLDGQRRAETLSLAEFAALARAVSLVRPGQGCVPAASPGVGPPA